MTMESLLRYLVEHGGSDLHLMAGLPPAIRAHGHLEPVEGAEDFTPESIQALVFSVLSEEQIDAYENDPKSRFELDFAHGIPNVGRYRFNVHRQRGTVAAVVRAIATDIPTLASLNLPESLIKFTEVSKGLALITGPTGSGKSTTLASLIDHINTTRAEHIVTIEDPIEFVHNSKKSYVTQREVGEDADTLSFSNALKYALRQDPDVILVGEMRDFETIGVAITSAETGHLVFGTLHTPSASQTIGRIIDVFPSDAQPQVVTQLSSNLVGVAAQILLPTVDGKGRAAAAEVMFANAAVRNCIRGNNIDGIYQAIQTGSKDGMMTMDGSIMKLIKEGRVSVDAARPHIRDEITMRQLNQMGGSANGAGTPARAVQPATSTAPGDQPATPTPAVAVAAAPPNGNGAGQPESAPKKRGGSRFSMMPPWEKKK